MALTETRVLNFKDMGLDNRLLQAISDLGWPKPTLIQERAIPLSLEGKDILARARTGSGKTAAYIIPLIQKLLDKKMSYSGVQCIRGAVLVPTKELGNQAYRNILQLTSHCSRDIRVVDISGKVALSAQKSLLQEQPDIVVGTPTRFLAHLQARNLTLKESLQHLIIDEADLIFSFGYQNDITLLIGYLPSIYQATLMSATLSGDVKNLKRMILHNPVILRLEESELPDTSQLTQYYIKIEEEDKFLLIYTLLKLALVRGKTLIFVNTVDRCYKLKLFLEQFAIPSCVLNSELPASSRIHIVNQFNDGLYDIIIACDERPLMGDEVAPLPQGSDDNNNPSTSSSKSDRSKKDNSKRKKDKESGVSRGIDFQNVSNVINFDFPHSLDAYIHRVGRTARGVNKGAALSFVDIKSLKEMEEVRQYFQTNLGEDLMKKFEFDLNEIESFRYRARDAHRAVTKIAIREARLKEIRIELVNSSKLKGYFDEHPRDLQVLRHDRTLHTVKVQPHLRHVPDYLLPTTLKGGYTGVSSDKESRKSSGASTLSKQQLKHKRKAEDPLHCLHLLSKKGKGKKKGGRKGKR